MKKLLAVLACALFLLGLPGCALSPDIENLISPPRLSETQEEILEAVREAAGAGELTLRYPIEGEYRSSVIFRDLDGDGADEALVFYEDITSALSTRIALLSEQQGRWMVLYDLSGMGSQVEQVDFARMVEGEADYMMIGWSTPGKTERTLSVYQMRQDRLEEIYTDGYLEFAVWDYSLDGWDDLIYLTFNSRQNTAVYYSGYRGKVGKVNEVTLSALSTGEYVSLTPGLLESGLGGLAADAMLDNGGCITEMLAVQENRLTCLTRDEEDAMVTRREQNLTTMDYDADGVLEIPADELMPGYRSRDEGEMVYRTDFYEVGQDGGLEYDFSAVVNQNGGYYFRLPEEWLDQVTVVIQPDTGQWQFVKFYRDLNQSTQVLLTISVYNNNETLDRFLEENSVQIAQRGLFTYYVTLPDRLSDPLAISLEQAQDCFHMIPQ